MEITMYGHCHIVAHIFKTLAFFLHRIVATADTQDFNLLCLDFNVLSASLALDQKSFNAQAGSCCDLLDDFRIKVLNIGNDLDVVYR